MLLCCWCHLAFYGPFGYGLLHVFLRSLTNFIKRVLRISEKSATSQSCSESLGEGNVLLHDFCYSLNQNCSSFSIKMHTTFRYTPTHGLVSIGTPLPFSALDIFVEDVGVDRKRREKGSNPYPLDLDEKMAIGGTADYKWSAISSRFPLAHISTCLWEKKT